MRAFVELSWPSWGSSGLELGHDPLRQHLAQLDAPLVERVDAPDRALGEHLVLVQGDERAERRRRQPLGDQDRSSAGCPGTSGAAPGGGDALGRDLVARLAERERLGLGEQVGDQEVVVVAERVRRRAGTR